MTSKQRPNVPALPSGTVTFLFTDIEGSTRLWETQREAMTEALARHDALLRQCIESRGGHIFKTGGDAFCAAFATAASWMWRSNGWSASTSSATLGWHDEDLDSAVEDARRSTLAAVHREDGAGDVDRFNSRYVY
jgi:class 3 adenylate cyclase